MPPPKTLPKHKDNFDLPVRTDARHQPAPPAEIKLSETRGFVLLQTIANAREFAEIVCTSGVAPKDYSGKDKVNAAIVAMQFGYEIGLQPLQALQSIAVVNGRPSLWGDGLRALILSAPDLERIEETDDGETATCVITRRGHAPVTAKFSMKDAVTAGLAGGNVWKSYPARMRKNRAFAFAARDAFADRLKGIASAEEQQDIEASEKNVTPKEPQPLVQATDVGQTGGVRRVTADQGGSTPPASTSTPPNGGTPLSVSRGAKILDTGYVAATQDRKEFWTLAADLGDGAQPATFLMATENLYNEATSCAGSGHLFALHWKLVARADKTVAKLLVQLDLDEGDGAL